MKPVDGNGCSLTGLETIVDVESGVGLEYGGGLVIVATTSGRDCFVPKTF